MKRSFLTFGAIAILLPGLAFAAPSKEDFIKDALHGDNAEISVGKLAQQKGSTEGVRNFGKMLATDHTKAKGDVDKLAKSMNVTLEKQVTDDQQSDYDKLAKLSGKDFDKAFIDQMVDDHQKDINEFQDEAKAKNGQVSALARKQLPTLKKHLATAQSLQKQEQAASN